MIVTTRKKLRDFIATWLTEAHTADPQRLTTPIAPEHIYGYKNIPPADAPTAVSVFTQNPATELSVIGSNADIVATFVIMLFASISDDEAVRADAEDFLDQAELEIIRRLANHIDPLWHLHDEIQNGMRDRVPALHGRYRTSAIFIKLQLEEQQL